MCPCALREEIAEKEDLIRSLLKDLAQAYNMRLGVDLSEYSVQEVCVPQRTYTAPAHFQIALLCMLLLGERHV